jgi:alkanesulfonate monooxygenase SsuD/methylene tetrahydromethanopterin reductase-like flavin-dependent oxidoreductase (luciferase family)
MTSPLRIGLKNSGQNTTIQALRDVWRIADEAGFDHVWDFDHLASIGPGGVARTVYEGWTLLAAIAASTRGACASAAWSPATSTGIRRCWQRWP